MAVSRNPFAFAPLPVTILSSLVYVAILVSILVVHHTLPSPPRDGVTAEWPGVNVSTAWDDLKTLSSQHHPFNSKANLHVRAWLIKRIEDIVNANGVDLARESISPSESAILGPSRASERAVLIDDRLSNVTFSSSAPAYTWLHYYEGDNVMVYVRGKLDPPGRFWHNTTDTSSDANLILVSAHFDSVSTGYGATDDGKGVLSALQLLAHFTHPATPAPRHGLVLLLNNEEEDGLYGSKAYTTHPLARHATAFLNLEGAGAGGRATLFRATDVGVARAYAASRHPFATVLSADGFRRGLVRSGTDYSNFVDAPLGMRGLDVAFFGPRSAYHTDWDDARHSSRASLWHMLEGALATVHALSEGEWDQDGREEAGVWFDVYGRALAVAGLRAVFALDVVLLSCGPLLLLTVQLLLKRAGKWYPFSRRTFLHGREDDQPVWLNGLRGFFRVPLVIVAGGGAVVALAWTVSWLNPYILYSSPYVVWTMLLSAHVVVLWVLLAAADVVRPSALSRLYGLLWLYVVSWVALLGSAVGMDRLQLAGTYPALFYNASVLLALLVSYLELFALPTKAHFASYSVHGSLRHVSSSRPTSSRVPNDHAGVEPSERTALLSPTSERSRPTFANYRRHSNDPSILPTADEELQDSAADLASPSRQPYGDEQAWSGALPSWTWIVQLLLVTAPNLLLLGQLGLFLTYALHQTPADGNAVLTIYLLFALITVLLCLPLLPFLHRVPWQLPFLHRVPWQLPFLLLLVCGASCGYNLALGAPFTDQSRLKVFFAQGVDLATGRNEVALVGVSGFVEKVVAELPSASSGGGVVCSSPGVGGFGRRWSARGELTSCIWAGLAPDVLRRYDEKHPPRLTEVQPVAPWSSAVEGGSVFRLAADAQDGNPISNLGDNATAITVGAHMGKWLTLLAERMPSSAIRVSHAAEDQGDAVLITLRGRNTRACRLDLRQQPSPSPEESSSVVASVTVLNACPALLAGHRNLTSAQLVGLACPKGSVAVSSSSSSDYDGQGKDVVVSLLSREFDETFRVVVRLEKRKTKEERGAVEEEKKEDKRAVLTGRAACMWADANVQGAVPALEEAVRFAPVWAAVTKNSDGLVEAGREFGV